MHRSPRLAGGLLAGTALLLAACGADEVDTTASETTTSDTTASPGTGGTGTGTIEVRLEQTDGIFIEGFEIGLRFDAADGTELDRVLWSDFVASTGSTDIDAYYDSVLEQPVPAGTVTVGADVRIGIGPGPEPPDLDAASLPCELDVEVPAGGRVEVEISFDGSADCVRAL